MAYGLQAPGFLGIPQYGSPSIYELSGANISAQGNGLEAGPNAYGDIASPAGTAGFSDSFGWNKGTVGMGLTGISTIGNLWGAFQAQKLAKEQFKFTKEVTNANLNNQIKSYNTGLEDRSRSRASMEGQSAAQAQAYVDANKLSR